MSQDPVLDALRQGRLLFEGGASLALGATVAGAAAALGIDPGRPQNRWTVKPGVQGESWKLKRGFLWYGAGRHEAELTFIGGALLRVAGPDDAWTDEGAAWSPEMFAHDVRQYDGTRRRLQERLGKPTDEIPGDDTLKLAVWVFPGAALTLRWESRSPSLLVSVDRSGPPPLAFGR